MRKSFQYRIYPTKKQEVALDRTLSICRHLYNDALAERKREAELNRLKQLISWRFKESERWGSGRMGRIAPAIANS